MAIINIANIDFAPGGGGEKINNQDKTVTPAVDAQTITADSGYTGLGTVTVAKTPLQTRNVKPYNTDYTYKPTGNNIGLSQVTVSAYNVDTAYNFLNMVATTGKRTLMTWEGGATISAWVDGIYGAYSSPLRGNKYSQSGLSFAGKSDLTAITYIVDDLYDGTISMALINNNPNLVSVCDINCTVMVYSFNNNPVLTTIGTLNCAVSSTMNLANNTALTTVGGFTDLGKGFTAVTTFDWSTCTALSHDSAVNIINSLYDLNSVEGTPAVGSTITFTTNLQDSLTEDEIKVATDKGWLIAFA